MSIETADKWYRQAKHDAEIAWGNLDLSGYDVAAFLAQQSVEKALKAVIALRGDKIPRTHYVDELAQKVGLPPELQDIALDLSSDYTFARYPDVADRVPFEQYDRPTAEKKVKDARLVIEYLERTNPALTERTNG